MNNFNILDFIFYKFYRLSIFLKSTKPLLYSIGLISTFATMLIFFITNYFIDIGLILINIIFYVILLILIFFLVYKYVSRNNKYNNIVQKYDSTLPTIINLFSDIVFGLLFLIVIFFPLLIY